jgi:hypothetical protein
MRKWPTIQHAKRKFIDVGNDNQAKDVTDTINQLYHIEHEMLPDRWTKMTAE